MRVWQRSWFPFVLLGISLLFVVGTTLAYLEFFFDSPFFQGVLFSATRWQILARKFAKSNVNFWLTTILLAVEGVAFLLGRYRRGTWRAACHGLALSNAGVFFLLGHHLLLLLTISQLAEPTASESDRFGAALLTATPFAISFAVAWWFAGVWHVAFPVREGESDRLAIAKLLTVATLFAAGFSLLAGLQYRAFHVPHGDTAMYEEHLWNSLHGKGFRSELDDGRLFLGEHFQVIHLLLIPFYLLYPSLVTLNVCLAIAIASGCLAIYFLARQLQLAPTAAWYLGAAYLTYFPLQYILLEASWKTFRPNGLAIPLLLFGLLALEKSNYGLAFLLAAATLLAEEEYAILLAALGFYLAMRRVRGPIGKREILAGFGMATFAIGFLVFALAVLIPHFRQGNVPHYTPYFGSMGKTPLEIVTYIFEHPRETYERIATGPHVYFLVLLLAPLAFLPLASPLRVSVSLPIFGYLMLSDRPALTEPWFHFHGPLIPILFWSTVAGVRGVGRWISPTLTARFLAALTLATGVWFGRSPLSWSFHDPHQGVPWQTTEEGPRFEPRGSYWKSIYMPQERARAFPSAYATIRSTDRVATTDYLRPRFTHHAAAHDYPTFRGHVTIDDRDVILLDKTEGWWGRGSENPDRELLRCLREGQCAPGTLLAVRGRPFEVVYNDPYFLVVRRLPAASISERQ
ncbi:MAG: DUF2079 domain-containing protein [Planctomycetota bacterium]